MCSSMMQGSMRVMDVGGRKVVCWGEGGYVGDRRRVTEELYYTDCSN